MTLYDNETAAAERDEFRSCLRTYRETDRHQACRHSRRGDNGVCACGDVVDWEEA